MSRCDLIKAMTYCEQAPGYSIYRHGCDVARRYESLHKLLMTGEATMAWSIPEKVLEALRPLAERALTPEAAHDYHVYHDCGKPYCLQIDEQGRRHFPGHAQVSSSTWASLYPEDHITIELMRLDMWCHTAKGEDRDHIAKHPLGPTLLLTAYAELHANAEVLFGGFDTDSFKIKRKALDKIALRF